MEILSIIGKEIIKSLSKTAFNRVLSLFSSKEQDILKTTKNNLSDLFELHLIEIIKWASNIPFIGLNVPVDTRSNTIDLTINTNITKYSKKQKYKLDDSEEEIIEDKAEKITETKFLEELKNSILIGHPGSGKTTVIKRLILDFFLNPKDSVQFELPILIRLRNLNEKSSVSISILDIFNIEYTVKIIKEEVQVKDKDGHFRKEIREKTITYVGKTLLENFIPKFLNSTKSLLLLDGLDEAPFHMQKSIIHEIEEIGLKLSNSRIIFTVRKSTLFSQISNFNKYEINPLNDTQIKLIVRKWLGKEIDFYKKLESMPYKDIANRPIFLTLLMILFKKTKTLPPNPYEVYREATYLIIKDWDEAREIDRMSKYSGFNARKKLRFLSEVSYLLTYRIKQKVFSSVELEKIYQQINNKYDLPNDEMKEVVAEIESHNGLIIESSFNKYEFSHLSFQEYLCAEHIVSMPFSQETMRYLNEYPEPLAIAICLSSEPSLWFANLINNSNLNIRDKTIFNEQNSLRNSLYRLISRLIIESPSFTISKEFGESLLFLLFIMFYESKEYVTLFFRFISSSQAIIDSINLALLDYSIFSFSDNVYKMERDQKREHSIFLSKIPDIGDISSLLFNSSSNVNYNVNKGKLILLLPTR